MYERGKRLKMYDKWAIIEGREGQSVKEKERRQGKKLKKKKYEDRKK